LAVASCDADDPLSAYQIGCLVRDLPQAVGPAAVL